MGNTTEIGLVSKLDHRLSLLSIAVALTLLGCTSGDATPTTTGDASTVTTTVTSPSPTFDMANFSMDQVINGPSLVWSETLSVGSARPYGLVPLSDQWFLFTSADMSVEGLTAWSTTDGLTWSEVGEVVPPGPEIGAIEVIGEWIVIVTEGDERAPARIWLSEDGVDWTSEAIPRDSDNEFLSFIPSTVGGDGDTLVVAGRSQVRADSFMASKVAAAFGSEYELSRYGLSIDTDVDDVEINVLGPLGFSMLTTSAGELGIEEPELSWLAAEPDTSSVQIWLRYGPDDWIPASIRDTTEVAAISSVPEGGMVAVGLSNTEQTVLWESFDGSIWAPIPFDVRPNNFGRWNDFLIGPSSVGSHDLLTSQNGIEWTSTSLADHLPPSLGWDFPVIGHNPDELASIVEAWDFQSRSDPTLEFPMIERDGLAVTVETSRGSGAISVFEDPRDSDVEGEIFAETWSPLSAADRERVIVDLATETLQLLDDDGSEVVSLAFNELEDLLERDFRFFQSFSVRHRGLAFTRDAQSWSISHLPDVGDDRDVVEVGVTHSTVFLITADHFNGAGVRVWTSALP